MSSPRADGAGPAVDPILCGVCGRPIFRGQYHEATFGWTPEGPPWVAHEICLEPFDEAALPIILEGLIP